MTTGLTPLQLQALQAAAEGERMKVTAYRLSTTINALKSLHEQVRRKLGAKTIPHAVAVAYRRGILS